MTRLKSFKAAALAAAFGVLAAAVPAQEVVKSPILTVEADRLFNESLYGQRLTEEIEAAGSEISAENRQIEAALTAEEKSLTEQRANLPTAEFRKLADAFDEKVQSIRQEQDAKGRALAARTEDVRRDFLEAAQPVLGELMREAGAAVLIERRNVFLSADAIDVTDEAIERINVRLGTGAAEDTGTDEPQTGTPEPDAEPDDR
ncbi:periplasmic chaperone for outer membrane proteins Skp [Primorskyibacter sedentarius]|uniref:Periplasmic chaperone for outer membrane proteins Skp n=1 Tax=Primorskyibacter sedentarius TaxID=745311 RepID=A0A4R3J5M8_9RHOB|nr:OmpH family outer membrane protein [Primorskyibacter sedentarius]TCS61138.1 periplasmic chaperone for outer membrane proteins Skp [Primorskyibacter sedentarius]